MHGLLIKYKITVSLIIVAFSLSGCLAPVVLGGSSTAAVMSSREKGIKGAFSDTGLSTKIKSKLYEFNPDMHAKVTVNVQNGDVFLMGIVTESNWKEEAERLAREVDGVTNVINNIETNGEESLGTLSGDSWITTKIKSKLMFADDVYSLNYSVKTIDGVVYIMGVVHDQQEMERVLNIAANVNGVKKVVNHLKISGLVDAGEGESESLTKSDGDISSSELPPPPSSVEDNEG